MNGQPSFTLSPDQLEQLAAYVARHLAAFLANEAHSGLIDAAEVARRHGVTRAWVYEHADRLGAIRLGTGSRPRLRFNPDRVTAALTQHGKTATPQRRRAGRRRRNTTNGGAPLLPIATEAA
jgi:hypothetical protein